MNTKLHIVSEPFPNFVDVEEIPVFIVSGISNLHLDAAKKINEAIFHDRLGYVDDFLCWWSGIEWQTMPDKTLERYIWTSLPEKYDRLPFMRGVVRAIKVIIPQRKSLPPNGKVFFRNLVYDCEDKKIKPHSKEFCNRSTLTHDYDPSAKNLVNWNKFSISMFGSLDDQKNVLLRQFFGWCLISHNLGIDQCAAFVGVSRAGKGTLLNILRAILGASCTTVDFNKLGTPRSHASMRAHNVVIDFDAKKPNPRHIAETTSTFVKVTSNDPISSDDFYTTKSISGPMNCKLVIACNKIPHLSDTTGALASRFHSLVFRNSFLGKEHRGLLPQLLEELPSITMLALSGLLDLLESDKPSRPKSSEEMQKDLIYNSNVLNGFVDEHVLPIPGEKCLISQLYDTYKLYSIEKKLPIMDMVAFTQRLKETLISKDITWIYVQVDNQQGKGAIGLRLVNPLRLKIKF